MLGDLDTAAMARLRSEGDERVRRYHAATTDEERAAVWAEIEAVFAAALARQVASEPAREAEWAATRAYGIARGRAEDAGVSAEQAHELGRQAMAESLLSESDKTQEVGER